MKKISYLFFLLSYLGFSQTPGDSAKIISKTTRLPFAIAKEKKLSDEDLKDKKEGIYVTGAPDLSSDPINGFGYGGEGTIFFNGKKVILFLNTRLIGQVLPLYCLIPHGVSANFF